MQRDHSYRIAVLADIHGNFPALRAVLNAAANDGVAHLFLLGDFVGYYYWPRECLDEIEDWPNDAIAGNHDKLLYSVARNSTALAKLTAQYGNGHKVACTTLSNNQLLWLGNLPDRLTVSVAGKTVLLCHGSPWSLDDYIYPDAPADVVEQMKEAPHDVVFFGHTHYQTLWAEGTICVANPGSVGQPRDRRPGAQWLLWEPNSGEIQHRCEQYDITEVAETCRLRDPGIPYLADVLTRM